MSKRIPQGPAREAVCQASASLCALQPNRATLSGVAAWDSCKIYYGTLIDEEICAESHICCRDYMRALAACAPENANAAVAIPGKQTFPPGRRADGGN